MMMMMMKTTMRMTITTMMQVVVTTMTVSRIDNSYQKTVRGSLHLNPNPN